MISSYGQTCPTFLSGFDEMCLNTTETYTTELGKNNYVWTCSGGVLNSGGGVGDTSITIDWGNVAGDYDITVTYNEASGCGAPVTTLTVTVGDDEDSTIASCPGSISLNTSDDGGADCEVVVNYTIPTFNDNCDGSGNATWVSGPQNGESLAASITPYTVVYTYQDATGNDVVSNCSFIITVTDNEDPTISCVGDQTAVADSGECYYTVVGAEFDPTSTDDNCGILSVINDFNSGSTLANAQITNGTTIVWTITDTSNRTDTCSFTVTVSDTQDPTIANLPTDVSINNDSGVCGAVVSWTAPTSGDNCLGSSIIRTAGAVSGTVFPIGITTITYTATDASSNIYSESFTITVTDNEAPTISCLSDVTVFTDPGLCTASGIVLGTPTTSGC